MVSAISQITNIEAILEEEKEQESIGELISKTIFCEDMQDVINKKIIEFLD